MQHFKIQIAFSCSVETLSGCIKLLGDLGQQCLGQGSRQTSKGLTNDQFLEYWKTHKKQWPKQRVFQSSSL